MFTIAINDGVHAHSRADMPTVIAGVAASSPLRVQNNSSLHLAQKPYSAQFLSLVKAVSAIQNDMYPGTEILENIEKGEEGEMFQAQLPTHPATLPTISDLP